MAKILLKGKNIYTGSRVIDSGFIYIDSGIIVQVGTQSDLSRVDISGVQMIEIDGNCLVIPGMIDVHIHGAVGCDVMDGTPEALEQISKALPKEGTTSYLATTLTEDKTLVKKALQTAGQYIKKQSPGKAEIVGIHLEGPFISPLRPGAQSKGHILQPNIEIFCEFQDDSSGYISLVTLAPEQPGGLELVKYLYENGVVASIGHSDANAVEMEQAVQAGAAHVTHLFNAMNPMHHREPGVAGSALLYNELLCEIIADGIHVHPKMVKLAYRLKGREGMVLITDAIRAKCMGEGSYALGDQTVTVEGGKAFLKDGTLAGSIVTMQEAFTNMLSFTDCTIEDLVYMTAVNPAKQLNLFSRKGSLEEGKDADIVVLDRSLNVEMTFCRGELAFVKERT